MSKKVKILISVLVAVVLLTVGGAATVLAQEPTPPPEAGTNGLLARVAAILGISLDDITSAFNQARQEMGEETPGKFRCAFRFRRALPGMSEEELIEALGRAVEEGRITQQQADKIRQWWQQRPGEETPGRFRQAFRFRGVLGMGEEELIKALGRAVEEGRIKQQQADKIQQWWQQRLGEDTPSAN